MKDGRELTERASELAEIDEITDREELRRRFLGYWQNVGFNLFAAVRIVQRFESLGYEFSEEDERECPMLPLLRLIANNQIHIELARKWLVSRRNLFEAARRLPLPDQKRLASDEPVRMLELNGDHRLLRPSNMNGREIDQLIDRKALKIRNESEQLAWIREQSFKSLMGAEEIGTEPVRMRGNGIDVLAPVHLSARRLKEIIKTLERKSE